jgi:hypothetical protein
MDKLILKKVEERFVGHIVHSDSLDSPEYSTFEIIKDDGCEPNYKVIHHEQWRSKEECIRYFENLLNIIKSEL